MKLMREFFKILEPRVSEQEIVESKEVIETWLETIIVNSGEKIIKNQVFSLRKTLADLKGKESFYKYTYSALRGASFRGKVIAKYTSIREDKYDDVYNSALGRAYMELTTFVLEKEDGKLKVTEAILNGFDITRKASFEISFLVFKKGDSIENEIKRRYGTHYQKPKLTGGYILFHGNKYRFFWDSGDKIIYYSVKENFNRKDKEKTKKERRRKLIVRETFAPQPSPA